MRLMPRQRREAMYAIYTLARTLDDIADGDDTPANKRQALAAWRQEIGALFAGRPTHPIARALSPVVARFGLPRVEFEELLRGMEMDVDGPLRAPFLAELDLYCRRVAGAVGLLSLPVFGCDGAAERAFAIRLGQALQRTNILRDLGEDAANGRLYLPREVLTAAGVTLAEPAAVLRHAALPRACAAFAAATERDFADAELLLAACDRPRLRPALVMMALYRRLLAALTARGYPGTGRPRISRVVQLGVALRVAVSARP
jgi:phytoene synthase